MENNTESFSVVPEFYFSKNEKVKELQISSLDMHLQFDEKRPRRFSFHNFEHIFAAVKGAMILYEKAKQENDDIFGLRVDLERWNNSHDLQGNNAISFEEFADVLRLAFSFHDLGNIADVIDGKVVLRESGLYKADGAEERSIEIARIMLRDKPELQKYLPLIEHLIEETKYNYLEKEDKEGNTGNARPFAVFVRVVDQIMTNYLRRDYPEFIEGLQEEAIDEKKEPLSKEKIENFTTTRLPELLVNLPQDRFPRLSELTLEQIKQKLNEIIRPFIPKNNNLIPILV